MEKVSLDILEKEINSYLEKQTISGRYLLDRFCLIDESSRKSPPYVDPKYAPFYYYLGKCLKPKTMVEIGFSLGLLSSSFMTSCGTVENFFGFKEKEKEFFSYKIGTINVKKVCKKQKSFLYGEVFEKEFEKEVGSRKWDLALINEEKDYDKQLMYIETLWTHMEKNGIIIVEYINSHKPSKEAFKSFTDSIAHKSCSFNTRYGTGLILKDDV